MNVVIIYGRLTKDPAVSYTGSGTACAKFSVAVDRPPKDNGEKAADFPNVTAWGKTAELAERFLRKGSRVLIHGRITTGQYKNKDGATVYTTDVTAERIEPIDWPEKSGAGAPAQVEQPPEVCKTCGSWGPGCATEKEAVVEPFCYELQAVMYGGEFCSRHKPKEEAKEKR